MGGTKKQKLSTREHKIAANALEQLLAMGYVNKRALYFENFVRGIFFSIGSVLGATMFIGIVIWVLSFFESTHFVGPVFREARQSLQQTK